MKELSSLTVRIDPCEWAQGHVRCVVHVVTGDGKSDGDHRFDETTFSRNDFIPLFERAMTEIARRIKGHFAELEQRKKNT